jgi:hypothetical protein
MSHLSSDGQYHRRGIVAEVHRQYVVMTRYGWSFGRCVDF